MLTDRASILREFFRLVNADASDDDLIEHDDSTLEGAYNLLGDAVLDAQLYLIDAKVGSRWAKTSSALSFTGTDPDKYADLPSDFLRLEGDQNRSGLRVGTIHWGREVPFEDRHLHTGNRFYIRGNEGDTGNEGNLRVYLCKGASSPTNAVADYFYRHPDLADGTTVEFDVADRSLIPAYAAFRATHMSWYPGSDREAEKIHRHLMFLQNQAWRRARYSGQPKMIRPHRVQGDRWY